MTLKDKLQTVIQSEFPKHEIYTAFLFGSLARDESTDESDVDVLIESNRRKLTFFELMDIKDTLEAELGRDVDLVEKASLKPNILPLVEKDAIKIYERQ